MLSFALLLLSTSSSAAFPMAYKGYLTGGSSGCNESNVFGEFTKLNATAMEENVFCDVDLFPGVGMVYPQKSVFNCNDAEKTVTVEQYDCYTPDCSVCNKDIDRVYIQDISVYEQVTEETCFEIDFPPGYQNFTFSQVSSFKFEDPSPFIQNLVEHSCLSTYVHSDPSSGEWVGVNIFFWSYVVTSVGFAALIG